LSINYFLNFLSEYCPNLYAIKTGINEKAIYVSKSPYSDNVINIAVERIIKIKSKVLFLFSFNFK